MFREVKMTSHKYSQPMSRVSLQGGISWAQSLSLRRKEFVPHIGHPNPGVYTKVMRPKHIWLWKPIVLMPREQWCVCWGGGLLHTPFWMYVHGFCMDLPKESAQRQQFENYI